MPYAASSFLNTRKTGTMNKIIALFAVLGLVGAASVPNFFDKCKKNDPKINDCLTKTANKGWSKFVEDVPVNFPNILKGNVYEGYMAGYDNIVFDKIKIDFKKKTLETIYSQPLMTLHADKFDVFVDFLGANLADAGSGNCTFTDSIFRYSFDYDIVERDGEEYMQLKNPRMTYNTNKLTFYISSTINKEQGVQLTNLYNNFWRLFNILGEVPLATFIADGIRPVVEKYLSSIPMKYLFI